MNQKENVMLLNHVDVGISKIELNKSDLCIVDKSLKYSFHVNVYYNWKDINLIKVGETKKIDFNEYCLSENDESALIWPDTCSVLKISEDLICFYLNFGDLRNKVDFMNKRQCFDMEITSLEVKVYIDYRDAKNGSIIYEY